MKNVFSILLLCFLLASCSERARLQKKAEAGDASAQLALGSLFETGVDGPKNEEEAVRLYFKAAEQGYQPAQRRVGMIYLYGGLGVVRDYAKAVEWLRKAAEDETDGLTQRLLGEMYEEGKGVPQNYVEALKWYRKAAEQGRDEDARCSLGVMYELGHGVPQDDAKAYMFFNIAAAKGSRDGEARRDKIEKRMTQEQIAEGQKLTREWLERNGLGQ